MRFKKIDSILLSVGFAVFLILLICAISIFGTFPVLDQFLRVKWHLLFLAFTGFVMVYCSARRLPILFRFYRYPEFDVPELYPPTEVYSKTIPIPKAENMIKIVDGLLNKRGYRRRLGPGGSREDAVYLYEKRKVGIFGPQIVHLGVAVTLTAGLITACYGRSYDVELKEGESVKIEGTDYSIKLEKFSVIPYPDSRQPKEYISRLKIKRPDLQPEWQTLKVNSPIRLGDFRLFQMRYRYEIERLNLVIYQPLEDKPLKSVQLRMNERVNIPGLNIGIEIDEFIPDFVMDEGGDVYSRSQLLDNPACRVLVYSPLGSKVPSQVSWAFRGFLSPHKKGEKDLWRFSIDRIQKRYVSGVKVTKDPAMPVVHFGFGLLVLGSFLSCYVFHRRIWIKLLHSGQEGIANVYIMADPSKNMFEFSQELNIFCRELEEGLKQL